MSPLIVRHRVAAMALALLALACFAFPALAGGPLSIVHGAASPKAAPALVQKAAGGYVDVVEYYNASLQHFFVTADTAEIAFLDGGAFGGAWVRTGGTFPAWDVAGAPAGTVPVCRFFGTDQYRVDGSRIGPNSHFYTADPAECALVKTAWPSVARDGRSYPAWTFEANAYAVRLPAGGTCEAGTQPLYRAYNNGARGDPNHRYSLQASLLQGMTGWTVEGLVMCVPQGPGVALPSTLRACEEGVTCPAGATRLGNGLGVVTLALTVTNPSPSPYELVVPAGQTFVAVSGETQDGIAIERLHATILPNTTRQFILPLYCLQSSRHPANDGDPYVVGPMTASAQLRDVISIVDGQLGPAFDPASLKATATQFAIWEITDGSGALSAGMRAALVQIMHMAGNDPALPGLVMTFIGIEP